MKAREIREMTSEEIQSRIAENERNLQSLRFHHAVAQLEDPMKLRRMRREVALLKTVLRQREMSTS